MLLILIVVLFNVFILSDVPNRAEVLKEQVIAIQSEIKEQESHMIELVFDIISYVEKYDKEKAEMLRRVVNARGLESDKLVEHIINLIDSVADDYPELQNSNEYKMMIGELKKIQNIITNTRNTYNSYVDKYNNYLEKFKEILNILGHESRNYVMYEN